MVLLPLGQNGCLECCPPIGPAVIFQVILASNLPETLVDLFLGFQSCRKLTDVSAEALGKALHRLKNLRRIFDIQWGNLQNEQPNGSCKGLPFFTHSTRVVL